MAIDRNMNILIVDDFAPMLVTMKNLLKKFELQNVDGAENGAQALQMMRHKSYGLVLSDWDMEPVTGLELLQEVRKDDVLKGTPFILVTSQDDGREIAAAAAAGVSAYIVKPFTESVLRDKIENVLGP
ncbi:MAG: response regulator, partial [Rhodospirillaceae bacterium]|nr:response regulator [Rhodospirillaceae bacterium]